MRCTLIISVLIFKFVYCAHIGFSENDKLENVEKNKDLERFETNNAILLNPDAFSIRKGSVETTEKQFLVNLRNPYNQVTSSLKENRCKRARSELYDKFIGIPKKFQKTSIKELVSVKQRKRCETCRESIRCRIQGKCDLCYRHCKDVDYLTTLPPPTSAPLVGSIQAYLEDENPTAEPSSNDNNMITPFEKSNRYYTIEAFGSGPKQNLMVRLKNAAKKKSLDKLGKPKGKIEDKNPEHPFIIDTAKTFQDNDNNKMIHAAVHSVNNKNTLQQAMDLDLSSKIDQELDMAVAEKQKIFGKTRLTNNEIDKIIDKVLSKGSSSHQPKLERDIVEIESRFNAPHITTKRSVLNWGLNKNREESLVGTPVPLPQSENKSHKPILRSNKRTANKPKNQNNFLNSMVGSSKTGNNNYNGDSYLAEDEDTEPNERSNFDSTDDSSETGQDLLEYEPAPPTYLDENLPKARFINDTSSVNQEKSTNVLNIPISNDETLESANQLLEEFSNSEEFPIQQADDINNDDEDMIVTLTQAPETYDPNNTHSNNLMRGINNSDPIVGSNWFSDEFDKAKNWWHENVGLETPSNFTNNTITQTENNNSQIGESKINLINANHFTAILKSLEKKVENIADLVEKTCGKVNSNDEKVGKEAPSFMRVPEEEEETLISNTNSKMQPGLSRNAVQVVNVPEDDSTAFDTIKTEIITDDPPRSQPSNILDSAMKDLNEGTNYLISKAVNIADRLQDDVFSPKRIVDKPLLQAAAAENTVGAAKMDRKVFSVDDPSVGCKEESEEYLGDPQSSKKDKGEDPSVACKEDSEEYVGDKLKNKVMDPLQQRSAIESDSATAPEKAKAEENVACSKEESGEYVGEQQNNHTDVNSHKNDDLENVACSKESEEYVGKSEQKNQNESLESKPIPSNKQNLKQEEHFEDSNPTQGITKIPINDEEVACSKEKSEEYVGDQKEGNLDETLSKNEDAVGCSKEEEEEIVVPLYRPHGYSPYRESNSKAKSDSATADLPKHKLPHIPALDTLLHRNILPHPLKDSSILRPLHKPAKTVLAQPSKALHRNVNVPSPAQKAIGPNVFNSDYEEKFPQIPSSNQKFSAESDNNEFIQNLDQPVRPIQRVNQKILDPLEIRDFQPEPNNENQNVSPIRQRLNKVLSPESLNQRFGENQGFDENQGDIVPAHRPKILQDWPRIKTGDDVLGVKKYTDINDDTEPTGNTQNPFAIFGKVVPQLNNTQVSFHHSPNDKIYFLGTGMQLPLNMKKEQDGTYQLSVDIDKLCSNCNENGCNKKNKEFSKIDKQNGTENKFNNEQVGMEPPPDPPGLEDVDNMPTSETNSTEVENVVDHSQLKPQEDVEDSNQMGPQKFRISAMDVPNSEIFNERNLPTDDLQIPKQPHLFEHGQKTSSRKFKHQPLFNIGSNAKRRQSKRSPSFDTDFPSLMNNNDMKQITGRNGVKNKAHQGNSLSVDASLKKIDENMKRYFDRRQELDNFYKKEVRRNLEEPEDGKDIVKRRVKLVNNVLTWMKSIAVEKPRGT